MSATADSSIGEFAQFKLVAHFLQSRSKRFNLLLLLRDNRFQVLQLMMLLQKLVERNNRLGLSGERIDYGVHGSFLLPVGVVLAARHKTKFSHAVADGYSSVDVYWWS